MRLNWKLSELCLHSWMTTTPLAALNRSQQRSPMGTDCKKRVSTNEVLIDPKFQFFFMERVVHVVDEAQFQDFTVLRTDAAGGSRG